MPRRHHVIFVAWTSRPGRARDIAAALGGSSYAVFPRALSSRRAAPARYAVSALATLGHLVRRRPSAVIVTNPPIVAAAVVGGYCAAAGVPFVLDSHPTAFGAKGHAVSRRLQPVHRALAKRAAATMVTTQGYADAVAAWGGRGIAVHEAPPQWSPTPARPLAGRRPQVLFAGIFGGDEPVGDVFDAARLLPDVDFIVTGDVTRCPPELRAAAPRNVTFPGYLEAEDYTRALSDADVVLALTTEPTSVMRAAYEAVYAERPLVVSDTFELRRLFPAAVFAENRPDAIAAGVEKALSERLRLLEAAPAARATQLARWSAQLEALQRHLHP